MASSVNFEEIHSSLLTFFRTQYFFINYELTFLRILRVATLVDIVFLSLEETIELIKLLKNDVTNDSDKSSRPTSSLFSYLCALQFSATHTFICNKVLLTEKLDKDFRNNFQDNIYFVDVLKSSGKPRLARWLLEYPIIYVQNIEESIDEIENNEGNCLGNEELRLCRVYLRKREADKNRQILLSFSFPKSIFSTQETEIIARLKSLFNSRLSEQQNAIWKNECEIEISDVCLPVVAL
ncbi:8954_t:CDS:2 [Ambispora leptoticha]|uniref:8954_t:CDS:1 n=1 Tax=Ambispora leptoticha TaxID=144679 RepID=A0A9N8ZZI3_9GLOM|nr:8954_t:CDS:2 [Ambispora leptoticha]